MSTNTRPSPSETTADLKAVIEHAMSGKPLAREVDRRICERAERVRTRLRKSAPTDIAVDLLRNSRDEQ